jgi:hypothetical protein
MIITYQFSFNHEDYWIDKNNAWYVVAKSVLLELEGKFMPPFTTFACV